MCMPPPIPTRQRNIVNYLLASLFPNSAIKLASSTVHAIVRNGAASAVKRTGQDPSGVGLAPDDVIMVAQQGPSFQT